MNYDSEIGSYRIMTTKEHMANRTPEVWQVDLECGGRASAFRVREDFGTSPRITKQMNRAYTAFIAAGIEPEAFETWEAAAAVYLPMARGELDRQIATLTNTGRM